jgi:two-component system, chemotaxis family, sensor kinase CheA
MDELLREFLTETNESLDVVDVELVRFERDPNNTGMLDRLFRLVHTIKGTCGFLGLPRLEALTHAAETLMGKFRDGMLVTGQAVSLILATIDRIKELLDNLERTQREGEGDDRDLIERLEHMALAGEAMPAGGRAAEWAVGTDVYQMLERPLRPGEVPLDELERAFRATEGPSSAATPASPADGHVPVPAAPGQSTPGRDKDERADGKVAIQSLRVNVDTLDHLMTMVSELVLTRNQLLEIVRRHEDSEFKVPLQRLSNVTAELQEGVMKTRMQPIGNAWQKLPRIVRDLAVDLGKEIELELHGEETELDRQVLDLIKDPLIHIVRNCADHGLEHPADRRAAGKPERGLIRLSASHQGSQIIIEIADDGRGLDTDKIKAKALSGAIVAADKIEAMSEAQIHKLVFMPGFSTADEVTNISGRGVGMDVVRNNIDEIGGTIDVKSVLGAGSSFIIKIPLTLAIVSALIVDVGGERFAIPQSSVIELVRVRANSEHRIERIKDTPVLRLRDKLLPLISLKHILGIDGGAQAESDKLFIVVTHIGNLGFGIVVDGVFHTEEIVVKPMSRRLRQIDCFSGNTILGDGSVIMIIDPGGVARALGAAVMSQDLSAEEAALPAEDADEQTTSLLIFRAGSSRPKAVPLSLVTRLEEIDGRKIELANGRHMVQYRDQLMPLVRVDESVRIREDGAQPLLVFSDGGRSMGLAVDEIVDIVEDRLNIELASEQPGMLGSAIIKGQATEVIDVAHFLPLAFEDWFRRKEMQERARPHVVLLVDDSAFFRNMLAPVLKAAGYRVATAESAAEALALIKRGERFDIVLTDIEMPDMDGFELTQALRADPGTAELPVIALSSMITAEAIERGRQVGFHDYVAKFDRAGLIAALKEQTADLTRAA